MDDTTQAPRRVDSALEEVASWRADAEQKNRQELADVDQEMESLRTAVANLQQQLEALKRFREELTRRDERVADEEVDRTYTAIFAALGEQAEALKARAAKGVAVEAERTQALIESMKDAAIAPLLQEYRHFKQVVEPTLAALPSYRSVILQTHDGIVRRLRDHIAKQVGGPAQVEAEVIGADVVYAVDAPEGTPEVLMLVLPVPEMVQTEWADRAEDLQTAVAARVVQAVYQACEAAGIPMAQAAFGGHQGLLAIEVEVSAARPDIGEKVGDALDKVLAGAEELTAAKLEVRARRVVVDHLLPPEEAATAGEQEVSHA